ncbi:MAG: ribose-phosphate diphosphokinase [Acetobacteraceae bacterium]|nr:ribose-phosphate diphosphokinase [Acetobacteraceae bacterium]
MNSHPLSFFGLQGSHDLAERVAGRLDIALAQHEERNFEDGEHKTRPLQDVRGHDVFVLHSLHGDASASGNDKLCRLLFFCGALKDAGAQRVTAITPYLCYARKDRRTKPNDPIITRYVAAMFEAVGIDCVITLEVHNVAAFENAFRCPTWHIENAPLLAAHFAPLLRDQAVVAVSPDAGGAKRAEQFRQALEHLTRKDVGSGYMEKYRSSGVVSGELLAGDVRGKAVVIVDDLISTGGTLVRAAKACRAAGAAKVFAAAAHGLFVGGAPELFATLALDGITVANTVPAFRVPAKVAARRLTVLDASDAIARAMTACHDGS